MSNIIAGLMGFGLIIAGIVGYIMNIIAIFAMNDNTPLGWIIGRILGVILPFIGAIIGYL